MTPDRWRQVERILQGALRCAPIARDALLDRECHNDDSLRAEVESLLAASSCAGDFLERPILLLHRMDAARDDIAIGDRLPIQIGSYEIVRRLGMGGMGVVYQAQQKTPCRTVALKVIRPISHDDGTRERFRREAEALGRLRHPGIAQIFEAGQADINGEPSAFIAMEYVDGASLTAYLAQRSPPVEERLRLFAELCDAVQHAHQKGVIHRDLKPANILVLDADSSTRDRPRIKVLDFGVAKIVDAETADATLSSPQHVVGTPAYMSPEQIDGAGRDIDTRTDVYALGVVGYQMLAESHPYEIRGKSRAEIAHAITSVPPRPLRIGATAAPPDLETILLRSLEKDPQRRYASAAALADDIRRFLAHEPIVARPPSAAYQLRLFARRNRGLVIGLVAACAGLVGGSALATWKAVESGRQRDRAIRAERLAGQRLAESRSAEAAARQEAANAEAVTGFLRRTLTTADPMTSGHRTDATIREALDRAAAHIQDDLKDQPRIEAKVRLTIGHTYRSVGAFAEALEHLNRAATLTESEYGATSLQIADVSESLGILYREMGRHDDSRNALETCLELRRAQMNPPSAEIASAETALASTLVRLGHYQEALALQEDSLTQQRALSDPNAESIAESLSALAIVLRHLGRFDDAEASYREALRLRESQQPPKPPVIAVTLHNLGRLFNETGRHREAAESIEQAIGILRETYAEPHPNLAVFLASQADALARLGRMMEAETALREAITLQRERFPENRLDLFKTLIAMADLPHIRDDIAESGRLLEEASQIVNLYGSLDDRFALSSRMVSLHVKSDDLDRAEALARSRLADMLEYYGAAHPNIANAHLTLAEVCLAQDQLTEARRNVEESLAIRRRIFGDEHPLVAMCLHNLALVQRRLGNADEAKSLYRDALAMRRAHAGDADPDTLDSAFQYAWLLCESHEAGNAEPLLRQCIRHYGEATDAASAIRLAESALLLQLAANESNAPGTNIQDIDAALARAAETLSADHNYLEQIRERISAMRANGALTGQ